jgi:hypothetical protein
MQIGTANNTAYAKVSARQRIRNLIIKSQIPPFSSSLLLRTVGIAPPHTDETAPTTATTANITTRIINAKNPKKNNSSSGMTIPPFSFNLLYYNTAIFNLQLKVFRRLAAAAKWLR